MPPTEFEFKLNSDKSPKGIEMVVILNGKKSALVAQGLYELNGDTLKVCRTNFSPIPPKAVAPEKGAMYMVFKRDKP